MLLPNPSRPRVAFLACVHLALFLALSVSPGNSPVSSWRDHSMLASLLRAHAAGQMALVSLEGVATFFPTMLRSRGSYSGTTTLSRSYLLQCAAATRVRAVLAYGQLNTGPADYNLLTFLVVPYRPRSVTATSWAVYRSARSIELCGFTRVPLDTEFTYLLRRRSERTSTLMLLCYVYNNNNNNNNHLTAVCPGQSG